MPLKVLLLNTNHYSKDDRVYFHQALSLINNGCEVLVCSTLEDKTEKEGSIVIHSEDISKLSIGLRMRWIREEIKKMNPEIIICDSPFAVISASFIPKVRAKVIYDITEWFPSKKNLANTHQFLKIFKGLLLLGVWLLAGVLSDGFIFGEYYKSLVFKRLFFWKCSVLLPYFPSIRFIRRIESVDISKKISILYSGLISEDKGIQNVYNSINELALICPDTLINLNIIGQYASEYDRLKFQEFMSSVSSNVKVEKCGYLPFNEFCNVIGENDIFLDLRKIDFENTHCLPIKLFYYIACGKPVVYSDLKSIRREFNDFNFGLLVSPNDSKRIAKIISEYIKDSELYKSACKNAYLASVSRHWEFVEGDFLQLVMGNKS